jgi:hypothetical protein
MHFSMMAVDFRALFNSIASVNAHYFERRLKLMPVRVRFSKRAMAPDSGTPSLDRHFERCRLTLQSRKEFKVHKAPAGSKGASGPGGRPFLHPTTSDTDSGTPYSFLGRRWGLPVSKEKASCGPLGGFSGRLESARTKVQASLLRASPGSVRSIARIH